MNKKVLAGILISGTLMVGSSISAIAGTSGYEVFKSALKTTHSAESMTSKVNLSIQDNGQTLFSAKALIKIDEVNKANSNTITFHNQGKTGTVEMFFQDGQLILKKSDEKTYFVSDKGIHTKGKHKHNFQDRTPEEQAALQKDVENVIDALTVNLQKQITLTEAADGDKQVNLELSNGEIPMVANALGTLLIKHAPGHHKAANNELKALMDSHPELPKLTQDIQIKGVSFQAEINDDNYIEEKTATITITGKDAQGKAHEVVFTIEADLSDFNKTSVNTLDLTGKSITKLDMGKKHQK
jgi:hypothetical protein